MKDAKSMGGGSLFLLVPPGSFTKNMPNLGDRALHEGMKSLWQTCHQGSCILDVWNSFPRLTWKKLSADKGVPAERFNDFYVRYRKVAEQPAILSQALAGLMFGPLFSWMPIWPVLNRMARKNTGQSGREALEPRLFPRLTAKNFAAKLTMADAVVMNGGGLLADHLARYLPGRIFALHAALQAGRPTAIVNYSFAITQKPLLELVGPVLRRITVHAVRESVSRDHLLALGVDSERIIVTRDAAFAVPSPLVQKVDDNQPIVALQIRGDRPQDIAAWSDLIGALRARFNARIAYVVGCQKNDPHIHTALSAQGVLDSIIVPNSLEEMKTAIGEAHVLITDRYHGIVFATQMGTPFVPLASTTHKTTGLVADLNYPHRIHPTLASGNMEPVLDDVAACLAARSTLSDSLRRQAEIFKEQLFRDYREIIDRLLQPTASKHTERGI